MHLILQHIICEELSFCSVAVSISSLRSACMPDNVRVWRVFYCLCGLDQLHCQLDLPLGRM